MKDMVNMRKKRKKGAFLRGKQKKKVEVVRGKGEGEEGTWRGGRRGKEKGPVLKKKGKPGTKGGSNLRWGGGKKMEQEELMGNMSRT